MKILKICQMIISWTTDKLWYIKKMEYYKFLKMN